MSEATQRELTTETAEKKERELFGKAAAAYYYDSAAFPVRYADLRECIITTATTEAQSRTADLERQLAELKRFKSTATKSAEALIGIGAEKSEEIAELKGALEVAEAERDQLREQLAKALNERDRAISDKDAVSANYDRLRDQESVTITNLRNVADQLRADLAAARKQNEEMREAAQSALLGLAVFKVAYEQKPFPEISPGLRDQLLKGHDLLFAAITPTH